MTDQRQEQIDFLRDLADVLTKHKADIDLRDEGVYEADNKIDLNVSFHSVLEFGTLITAEALLDRIETLS